MLVCFFSEISLQEVADWRPSDARREGRGHAPLSILLQQRPSGLHPGPLLALQSSVFKDGGAGRPVVIPPPPHHHLKALAAVLHLRRKELNHEHSL